MSVCLAFALKVFADVKRQLEVELGMTLDVANAALARSGIPIPKKVTNKLTAVFGVGADDNRRSIAAGYAGSNRHGSVADLRPRHGSIVDIQSPTTQVNRFLHFYPCARRF